MGRAFKFVLGIPAYRGNVHGGHLEQMMSLCGATFAAQGMLSFVGLVRPDTCSVDRSRNHIVSHALKAKAHAVLMCDADTYHPIAADLVKMMAAANDRHAAVIAAPVKLRGKPGWNVLARRPDEAPAEFVAPEHWKGRIAEVERIGTACMAINLNWIRDHWPEQPWFQTRHLSGGDPRSIGEDINFCDQVRDRGGTILADGRFEPIHVGS